MSSTPKTAVMGGAGNALVVEHLTVRRGPVTALDDVSLTLMPLELHGVIGPRGAGKTTLLEAIAGFSDATGDVMLGAAPLDREQRRRHTFYVADDITPYADERVGAVLRFASASLRVSDLADVVARVDIAALQSRRMRELTRGEKKRVLVAMGLLVPTGWVLFDEPFDGLDLKEKRALQTVLRTSTNERRSILCALQQIADAERLCDRFTLLSHGRVVGAGQLHELRERARVHPGASLEETFLALA